MKKQSITEAFYKNAGYIAVMLISAMYVAGSLVTISRTGRSVQEIVGTGVISLIVGIMINGCFRTIGIRRGDEDERMEATVALHGACVEEIAPYIELLDDFCAQESKTALKEARTRILCREGMRYTDCFDSEGVAIPCSFKKEERKRKRAYNKALRVRVTPLASSALTTNGASHKDPYDFGKSKKEFSGYRGASDLLIRLVMAIMFGYFGVQLSGEINVAVLIWNGLQIVLYVTGGIIQMYSSYMWVIEDYRGGIVRRIDVLQKFKRWAVDKRECV